MSADTKKKASRALSAGPDDGSLKEAAQGTTRRRGASASKSSYSWTPAYIKEAGRVSKDPAEKLEGRSQKTGLSDHRVAASPQSHPAEMPVSRGQKRDAHQRSIAPAAQHETGSLTGAGDSSGQGSFDAQSMTAAAVRQPTGSDAVADESGHITNEARLPDARSSAPFITNPAAMPVGGDQKESDIARAFFLSPQPYPASDAGMQEPIKEVVPELPVAPASIRESSSVVTEDQRESLPHDFSVPAPLEGGGIHQSDEPHLTLDASSPASSIPVRARPRRPILTLPPKRSKTDEVVVKQEPEETPVGLDHSTPDLQRQDVQATPLPDPGETPDDEVRNESVSNHADCDLVGLQQTGSDAVADEPGHSGCETQKPFARSSAPFTTDPADMPEGGDHSHGDSISANLLSPLPDSAETPGGDGHYVRDDRPTPAVSSQPAVRKRGRPRKTINKVESTSMLSSGDTDSEILPSAGGGGHRSYDTHGSTASPTETAPRKRGRPPKATVAVASSHGLPSAAPTTEHDMQSGGLHDHEADAETRPETAAGRGQPLSVTLGRGASPAPDAPVPTPSGPYPGSQSFLPTTPELMLVIQSIQENQRKRIFAMKSQRRQENATLALMRTLLGWTFGGSEAANNKINTRAREIVQDIILRHELDALMEKKHILDSSPSADPKAVRETDRKLTSAVRAVAKLKPMTPHEQKVADDYREVVIASMHATSPWESLREHHEAEMEELAKQLPVYEWMLGVKGLGALGLAKIVGETGDFMKYDRASRIWMRNGTGCVDGRRQGDPGPGATAEDWKRHGYNPNRRSNLWNIAKYLTMAGWRGAKEDPETGEIIGGYAISKYGQIYADRKAYETLKNEAGDYAHQAAEIVARAKDKSKVNAENLAGRLTKAHIDNRARRYTGKRMLLDMWKAWRRARRIPGTEPEQQDHDGHQEAAE